MPLVRFDARDKMWRRNPTRMSHSHVRVPKRQSQPERRKWLEYVLVSVITLMVVTPVFVNRMSPLAFSPAHETTYGSVLETRIDVVNLGSGRYGGYIDYQIEAGVRYQFARQTYERWMPASQVSTSRSLLEAQPLIARSYATFTGPLGILRTRVVGLS